MAMTFADVFTLEPLMEHRVAFWFQPRGDWEWDRFDRIHRGQLEPEAPVELRASEGRMLTDVVRNSSGFLIVSKRLFDGFRARGFTGCRAFPVKLFDRKDRRVGHDYTGLAITGRSGPLDAARCVTKWSQAADGTRRPLSMSGLYFYLARWDGSDFFELEDWGAVLVTKRVVDTLAELKATGWAAVPVAEYKY